MMTVDSAVRRVKEAITQGRCLIFVGAGVSAWQGIQEPSDLRVVFKGLPDEAELPVDQAVEWVLKFCQRDLHIQTALNLRELKGAPPTWFLRACMLAMFGAEERKTEFTKALTALAEDLSQRRPTDLRSLLHYLFRPALPNEWHRTLAMLPFQVLVTTNFDRCLEAANAELGVVLHARVSDEELVKQGVPQPLLLKVHGGLALDDRVDGCDEAGLTLTTGSYRAAGRELMMRHLEVLMATHQTLFLGYGLGDADVCGAILNLHRHFGKKDDAIAVVLKPSQKETTFWETGHVQMVDGDLGEFLRTLWTKFFHVDYQIFHRDLGPAALARHRRPDIAVAMLLRLAGKSDKFRSALELALFQRAFPETLLADCDVWPRDGFGQFLVMKWVRLLNLFAKDRVDRFYEFHDDVREALIQRLGLYRKWRGVEH